MSQMTRDQFRESVFKRDKHACVICGDGVHNGVAIDAHHIIERRLWSDGGYYLDNGATLCDKGKLGCHYKAETTWISVDDVRIAAGILNAIIPEDMYSDNTYDKWGNIILASTSRTKGPLFNDPSVQSVLRDYATFNNGNDIDFLEYVKYPRTYHVPWSPGITDDDRIVKDMNIFDDNRVVVTRKMDGENFTGYNNYCHARSVDGRHHYTRDWAKNFWAQRSYELPDGWRVCAENLYAVHSIAYDDLPSYLLGFSIWNDINECLSWDDTIEWFQLLGIPSVPVLYDGIYDQSKIQAMYDDKKDYDCHEGYVIRSADAFEYGNFRNNVAKFVRPNHVQSQKHWFYGSNNHDINKLEK